LTAWKRLEPIYSNGCPNCSGPASSDRLSRGLPCERCLPRPPEGLEGLEYHEAVELIGRKLSENGTMKGYSYIYNSVKTLKLFEEFFAKATGSRLWSAQRTWAKRLLQDESLAIVAPTGVGKTTLLSVYALYRAEEGAKVYYLLPTENLARQVAAKLEKLASRAGLDVRVVAYYSGLSRKARESALAAIERGDYDILVTTTGFLGRRWSLLEGRRFDVVLVDDVDAVLKNSRNVEKLLMLLGFSEETIAKAVLLIKKKIAAVVAKLSGRMKSYAKLLEEIHALEAEVARAITLEAPGQLVIASATGRARGLKPKLFRELLGFEIGRVHDYTRSITNFYTVVEDLDKALEKVAEIVADLGPGGLVFVAPRFGKSVARRLAEMLSSRGLRAAAALSGRRVLDRFAEGELDVLVGVSTYYGVIVRGVDLPERVLYTVFLGVPSSSRSLDNALNSPYTITRLAIELGYPEAEELARRVARLSSSEATALRIALAHGETLEGRLGELQADLLEARRWVAKQLRSLLCRGERRGKAVLAGGLYVCSDGSISVITPDAATYVQASGRASRMKGSGMTHGVSVVVETEEELVELLRSRLRSFIEEPRFEPLKWDRLMEEMEEARRSRRQGGRRVDIETCMIVVESPTKAKTIASFFGRPVRRKLGSLIVYETTFLNPVTGRIHVASIVATAGHLYDLSIDGEGIHGVEVEGSTVKPVYKPIKRCLACGHQFSSDSMVCPRCGSANVATKEEVVAALRELAFESEKVYIATDPDIEGEKIAYDIYMMLKPYARSIERIELHEITRQELMRALAQPRRVDERMAAAQMLRRIEDRWIGFTLSQHLWSVFNKHWLGAGRVQTPVLGWIIERYEAWRHGLGYNVYIRLTGRLRLRLHYDTAGEARAAAEEAQKGLEVVDVEEEVRELPPPPPFTTETLIYEASRRFGYSAEKTMRIAQELFEAGLITYHRTDSTHVSATGIGVARSYLEKKGMANLFAPRSWGPQGHHEAIRPTKPLDEEELRRLIATGELRLNITMRESHFRLYGLIFRRFVASQMTPAKLKLRRLRVRVGSEYAVLEVYTSKLAEGYHAVYPTPPVVGELADVAPRSLLKPVEVVVRRGSTVTLYTHGDVVLLMKRRGIGRPSTYARTLEALRRHGYVIESKYRKRLVPTKLGREVYAYLAASFPSLVSEERTRRLMEEIEAVARGEISPTVLLAELYSELVALVERAGARQGAEGAHAEA